MADPYVYPGTAVLRNLAGLENAGALAEREAQASTLRLAQISARGLQGAYDLPHLQAFHRFIFQDIYPWAGELRSVPLAKPDSMFALPEHVESYATALLGQLAELGRAQPPPAIAGRITKVSPLPTAVSSPSSTRTSSSLRYTLT